MKKKTYNLDFKFTGLEIEYMYGLVASTLDSYEFGEDYDVEYVQSLTRLKKLLNTLVSK